MELNEIKQYDAEPGKTPRLFPYSEPGGKLTEYAYDSAGNRASETVTVNSSLVSAITYEVDNLNRLVRTTEETANETIVNDYFYDGAGNLTGRRPEVFSDASGGEAVGVGLPGCGGLEPAIYGYNDKNQLVNAQAEGNEVANTFNFQGYRSSKTADGVTTDYLYEYDRIIKELDSQSNAVYNVYGLSLISREIDSDKVYYVYNGHGDVTAITSDSGVVIKSYYYDAFGVILAETGSFSNHFTYAGYFYDAEVKLYDLKARFYDAKIARFMQEDTYWNTNNCFGNGPVPDNISIMQSLNLYTYCVNNPLRYSDPTGHYLSDWDKANLTSAQQKEIEQLTNDWNKANAANNKAEMDRIHAAAEAIRATGGYSGGGDGNNVTVINSGSYSNNGTINSLNTGNGTKTVIDNTGTIYTVTTGSGSNTTLNNSGTIGNVYTGSNSTTYIDNSGSIKSVNTGSNSTTGILNNDYIGSIITGAGNSSVTSIANYGEINRIASGKDSLVGVGNAGTINSITTGANSTANIYNYGNINAITTGGKSTANILNNDTGTINKISFGVGSTYTGNSTGHIYNVLFANSNGGYSSFLTDPDLRASVEVALINGSFYKDFTTPLTKALNNTVSYAEYLRSSANAVLNMPGITTGIYAELYALNLVWFYNQVNHSAPWDIKRQIPWNTTIAAGTYPGGPNALIVVNGSIRSLEELGNMTYGYIGTALGLSQGVLLAGGDFADGGIKGVFTRSDSPEDKAAIILGINWYKNR